ncbi:MAG: hypothetical protein DLM61_12165 [Pseudonocardiales bacterium]|nr:MAG: hypothetical protein DLM61_12165 [Pseudonocardiales bacterium]
MRREWEPEDLIAHWTLVDPDWELIANKSGAPRLGFTAVLKSSRSKGGSRSTRPRSPSRP